MKFPVLSVQATTFKDQKDGSEKNMWKVFVADDTGNVGSLYSSQPVKVGEVIELIFAVNRDGKFVAKIKPAPVPNDGRSGAKIPD